MLGCTGAVVRAGSRQITRALGGSTRTPGYSPGGAGGVTEQDKTASFSSPSQANTNTRMYPTLEKVSQCMPVWLFLPCTVASMLDNCYDVLYSQYVQNIIYWKLHNLTSCLSIINFETRLYDTCIISLTALALGLVIFNTAISVSSNPTWWFISLAVGVVETRPDTHQGPGARRASHQFYSGRGIPQAAGEVRMKLRNNIV